MADKPDRRQQRADRNRKRLLSAAMRVFSQKGYYKATLEEIRRRANLGKGTIYNYFSDKKGLFMGLVDSLLAELGASVKDAVSGIKDDVSRLRAAISAYVQFSEGHRSFCRILIHEQSSFAKELRERAHSGTLGHLDMLEGILRDGMKNGKLKKMDPRSAAFCLLGMCNSIIFRWLISQKPYPLKREVHLIEEIFLDGITLQPTGRGE